MAKDSSALPKFRPERPIYLNKDNTGKSSEIEVELVVEQLRDRRWLCVHNEEINKPLHLSFVNEKELAEFKKDCKEIGLKLKNPIIKLDDLEEMEAKENTGQIVVGAEDRESVEYLDEKSAA